MKLYIGNLSFDATEDDLRELFAPYGPVMDLYIAEDRYTGQPRGFAFITLENRQMGEEAIRALDGHELGGRALRINEAMPKPSFGGGGGDFGGGGGGGRGKGGGGGGGRDWKGKKGGGGGGRRY